MHLLRQGGRWRLMLTRFCNDGGCRAGVGRSGDRPSGGPVGSAIVVLRSHVAITAGHGQLRT